MKPIDLLTIKASLIHYQWVLIMYDGEKQRKLEGYIHRNRKQLHRAVRLLERRKTERSNWWACLLNPDKEFERIRVGERRANDAHKEV